MSRLTAAVAVFLCGACQAVPPDLDPGTFSFAVLGDAPYQFPEPAQFRRVLRELDSADLRLVMHVGDMLWYPCSDNLYRQRLAQFNSQRHPLVYTPGDNEWTDCHEPIAGSYDPLARLERLRAIMYEVPTTSLGGRPIPLTIQAADTAWAEFVENARWSEARIVFSTVHLVGAWNGFASFSGRTERSDVEARRRTAAATAWLTETFAYADTVEALGIVIGMHTNPNFAEPVDDRYRQMYEPFLERLEELVEQFDGSVLVVHGDNHEFLVDRPLVRRTTGQPLHNFTRMQVPGSPDVGWVEVAVDTAAAEMFRFRQHRVPRWMIW